MSEPVGEPQRISHVQPLDAGRYRSDVDTAALIAQLQADNQRLQRECRRLTALSERDPVTQLFSRRHFDERLRYEWNRAERFWTPLSLLALAVDDPVGLVDRGGEGAARAVLGRCAHLLRDHCRDVDIPCRIGDWEFAVILPATNRTAAEAELSHLRRLWRATDELPALPQLDDVFVGFGMAVAFDEAQTPLELLMLADEAILLDRRRRDHDRAPTTPAVARPTWTDAA